MLIESSALQFIKHVINALKIILLLFQNNNTNILELYIKITLW